LSCVSNVENIFICIIFCTDVKTYIQIYSRQWFNILYFILLLVFVLVLSYCIWDQNEERGIEGMWVFDMKRWFEMLWVY
jgi:hypothetical protein